MRILLVEDDPDLFGLVEAAVEDIGAGLQLDWVTNAEDAMAFLKDAKKGPEVGLVIADLFLDGAGTGIDLMEFCRTQMPQLPVVVTSALPMEKFFAALGRDAVAPPFIGKPFKLHEMRQMLSGILRYGRKKAAS